MKEIQDQTRPILAQCLQTYPWKFSLRRANLGIELAEYITTYMPPYECLIRVFFTSLHVKVNDAKWNLEKNLRQYEIVLKTFSGWFPRYQSRRQVFCNMFSNKRTQTSLTFNQSIHFALKALLSVTGSGDDPVSNQFRHWLDSLTEKRATKTTIDASKEAGAEDEINPIIGQITWTEPHPDTWCPPEEVQAVLKRLEQENAANAGSITSQD